jgi:predicted ribosome quality control (RQC) complex YloA/Tae2 family protein
MHFDALATACMAAELERLLCGGRVQGVVLVDADSVGLEVYAQGVRRQLLLCAAAAGARLHLVDHKLRRGVQGETPLLLLLRKYLRDAVLVGVTQPDPYERVVRLACEHREHGATVLLLELIGRQANLLLLRADGRILECLHRRGQRPPGGTPDLSVPLPPGGGEARVLLPGRLYVGPPAQGKLPPRDDGRPDYYERLAAVLGEGGKLHKVLVAAVAGLSPAAAREVAWRATGDAEAPAAAANVLALAAALQALWGPAAPGGGEAGGEGGWEPGKLLQGGRVAAFAPYVIHGAGEFVRTETLSAAVEAYYADVQVAGSPPVGGGPPSGGGRPGRGGTEAGGAEESAGPAEGVQADAYAQQRANVGGLLRRARQGIERRLAGLAADEPLPGEAQRLRTAAEWLLALSSQIAPGQELLEVPLDGGAAAGDLGEGGAAGGAGEAGEPVKEGRLRIVLDPEVAPVEQAQRLFKRAAKLERAALFIPQRRAELEQDLRLVEELALDLQRAANQPEIAAVQAELQAAGLLSGTGEARRAPGRAAGRTAGRTGGQAAGRGDKGAAAGAPGSKGGLLRVRSPQGLEIVVGRNARQNERVTFDEAHPEDLWLHARGVPGSHVVIRGAGQAPDAETVRMAAQLAAYHSGARGDAAVAVIVTRKRFVQRAPGGKVGQVLVKQEEQVVTVRGELPAEG